MDVDFSRKRIIRIILPLIIDQFLVVFMGIADTAIVSFVGEGAMSGVSLVTQINLMFFYVFLAFSSGGSVVVSQYIGSGNRDKACKAASQLFMISILSSFILMIAVLLFGNNLLSILFPNVDEEIMESCKIYLRINAYSYPGIALYTAGSSLYRSMGITDVPMFISGILNVANVVGNYIGVIVLNLGVAGAAWPSSFVRMCSATWISILCFNKIKEVHYEWKYVLHIDKDMLKRILRVGIPEGVENLVFQFVKIALSGMVAIFGTYQIAAYGVALNVWSFAALAGVALGPAFVTIIGQCMGSRNIKLAEHYFSVLLKITIGMSIVWNGLVLAFMPLILKFYQLESNTIRLLYMLVILHNVFNSIAFPFFGTLSYGLRATGDVKFVMMLSIGTTIVVRLLLSWILGVVLGLGALGITASMCIEWVVKGVIQYGRLKSGTWKYSKVI